MKILPAALCVMFFTTGCGLLSSILPYRPPKHEAVRMEPRQVETVPDEPLKVREPVSVPETVAQPADITEPAEMALSPLQKRLVNTAMGKVGCRYKYAAKGPDAFDCSGFTLYVFAQEGIRLLPGSVSQFTQGRALDKDEPLRTCDLVFFSGRKISGSVGHVGMVLDYDAATGEFTFIHAASTGVEVQSSKAEYYARRYLGARRILGDGQ